MPKIKCPRCGTVRVVVEGKAKSCRKCGERLTTIPAKQPKTAELTAEQIAERYPRGTAEIVAATRADERAAVLEQIAEADAKLGAAVDIILNPPAAELPGPPPAKTRKKATGKTTKSKGKGKGAK